MKMYPHPNVVNCSSLSNYTNVPVRSLNEGEFDISLDHNFSSKDSVFARFSYDQATTFIPGGSPGFAEQNAFGSTQNITNHGRNVAISETHIFSDRNINQVTSATTGFSITFCRSGQQLPGRQHRHPGRKLEQQMRPNARASGSCSTVDKRLHELRHEFDPDEQLLGPRRSWIRPLPGRNQRLPDFRLLRHDSR